MVDADTTALTSKAERGRTLDALLRIAVDGEPMCTYFGAQHALRTIGISNCKKTIAVQRLLLFPFDNCSMSSRHSRLDTVDIWVGVLAKSANNVDV